MHTHASFEKYQLGTKEITSHIQPVNMDLDVNTESTPVNMFQQNYYFCTKILYYSCIRILAPIDKCT